MWLLTLFSSPRLSDAESELSAELKEFSHDGLTQLALDLEAGTVKRGTWDGCVLSYRCGFAGSVDCDRKGRRGNAFTRFWDAEKIEESRVAEIVRAEIGARTPPETEPAPAPRPEPATVG